MAKRDPEIEAANDEPVPEVPPTVGERLRAAREQHGISLEDVAAQTRIPQRHLVSIEAAEWDSLPAPTYTIGFAKNYAAVVGLDRAEIGDQLREEMGGQRFATTSADVFEPADPRRTMPKSLVIGAVIAAVLLIALMSFLNRRSLEEPDQNAAINAAASNAPAPSAQPAPAPSAPVPASGQVVLTAIGAAWIQVIDQGKTLFQGELQPGQAYTVPATVTAPMLKAGKPEALKVTVGATTVPQVGPTGKVTTVSLLPSDLLKGSAVATPPPGPQPTLSAPPARPRSRAQRRPPAAAPPPATDPVTNGQ
ncbi:MAG: helix-turn-helix domain-containing protein [Sphingomicrobium sp.]